MFNNMYCINNFGIKIHIK